MSRLAVLHTSATYSFEHWRLQKLSFFSIGTAPTGRAIWTGERDISFAGYMSAYGRQRVASALQPALFLCSVTEWARRMKNNRIN